MVPPPPGFVCVSADGASFELDGVRWRVAGANCYYLLVRAANAWVQARPSRPRFGPFAQPAGHSKRRHARPTPPRCPRCCTPWTTQPQRGSRCCAAGPLRMASNSGTHCSRRRAGSTLAYLPRWTECWPRQRGAACACCSASPTTGRTMEVRPAREQSNGRRRMGGWSLALACRHAGCPSFSFSLNIATPRHAPIRGLGPAAAQGAGRASSRGRGAGTRGGGRVRGLLRRPPLPAHVPALCARGGDPGEQPHRRGLQASAAREWKRAATVWRPLPSLTRHTLPFLRQHQSSNLLPWPHPGQLPSSSPEMTPPF